MVFTGGNRTVQLQPSSASSVAAAKKAQQNVFALYHSYNRTILLGFIWILDFHFKIVLVLRRRYLIPIRCNNGKRKIWPWRWLHQCGYMEHGLKHITLYVQKHIAALGMCYNPALVRDKPLGAPASVKSVCSRSNDCFPISIIIH